MANIDGKELLSHIRAVNFTGEFRLLFLIKILTQIEHACRS